MASTKKAVPTADEDLKALEMEESDTASFAPGTNILDDPALKAVFDKLELEDLEAKKP